LLLLGAGSAGSQSVIHVKRENKKGNVIMKPHTYVSTLTGLASRQATSTMLRAILVGLLFVQAHSAFALSFVRGTATSVGTEQFSSTTDTDTLTGAFTAAGVITNGLSIPEHRVQYDIITSSGGSLTSWTVNYSPTLAADIIGAITPIGFVDSGGMMHSQGGQAFTTLFNKGFGVYTYNTGAPWTIDFEADHVTFTGAPGLALPAGAGVGDLSPTAFLPSFDLEFSPKVPFGDVPASVLVGTATGSGTVTGPVVPEPSTVSLVLCGVAMMGCRRLHRA
jgi:hypothetical protein